MYCIDLLVNAVASNKDNNKLSDIKHIFYSEDQTHDKAE